MRVLAISHLFPHENEPRYGIFVARQLAALARLGVDVTVVVPRVWCPGILRLFNRWRNYDHKASLCEYSGLNTLAVPYVRPPGNWYNNWSGNVVFQTVKSEIESLHGKEKFDLIYATDLFPDGDAAVRLSKHLGIPASCLFIGVDVNITVKSTPRLFSRFVSIVSSLDGLLACGKSVQEGISAVTSKPVLNVYGTVDLCEFSPLGEVSEIRRALGIPADRLVLLFAGYLSRRKGVYDLFRAYLKVREKFPATCLVMCGDGAEAPELMRLARTHSLEKDILFAGDVVPTRMHQWMKACDVFVLPSYTEGVPNVVMEAMACGLPVITTTVGGLPDAIGDSGGAALVPPGDVDVLHREIIRILSDGALRRRMGAASRKSAETKFGIESNAKSILNLFEQIIASRNLGPVS